METEKNVTTCRYCGKQLPEEAIFCYYCRRELITRPERPEAESIPWKLNWQVLLGIAVTIMIVIILIILL